MTILVFTKGPHAGMELELPNKPITLGRDTDANFTLDDNAVSRHHIEVGQHQGVWYVKDLDSANGTLVNGNPITEHVLQHGDVIELGESECKFIGTSAPNEQSEADSEADTSPPPAVKQRQEEKRGTAPPYRPRDVPEATANDVALVKEMRDRTEQIRQEIGKIIVGQREVLDQILMCIVANGHALLIGLPGMAKTLTVRTLAQVLNLEYKRVQLTPDLMPSDIIGTDVLETNQSTGEKEFRFIRGPIFCNLLLADEINRTPPKTQAALLEAMQEKCVTAGNETYKLDEPFFVLASQNPIEQEGTYPLPEAQLDRFMFNIYVDYPEEHEEEQIIGATTSGAMATVEPVLTKESILQIQEVVRKVPVSDHVIKYAIRLVRSTRPSDKRAPDITKRYVSTGAGPRAGQYLILAAKAMAILDGRIHVSCNDIRRAATPVLRHRILTNFAADSEGITPMTLIKDLIAEVPEPSEADYEEAVNS